MSGLRKAGSLLVTAILTVLLFWNLFQFAARAVNPQRLPFLFGLSGAVVRSGSMGGTIEVNDIVIITKGTDCKTGDIITFYDGTGFVTHRIVEQTQEGYVTQGDANNTPDQKPVAEKQVQGKVACVIPKIGGLVTWMQSGFGWSLIIIIAVAAFIGPYWFKSQKGRNTYEELDEEIPKQTGKTG